MVSSHCSFSRDSCSTAGPYGSPCSARPALKWTIFPGSAQIRIISVLSRQLRSLARASTLLHVLFVHVRLAFQSSIKANTGAKAWWLCLLLKGKLYIDSEGGCPESAHLFCSYTLNCRLEMTFGLILSAFDIGSFSKQRQTTFHHLV